MKMIAGLGNPGSEYARTKHNVGFMFLDALAEKLGADNWKTKYDALVAEARIGTEKVLLVKPLTYMNESGRAVGPLMSWYKLAPEDLIVVHDDMDIPAGTIRIRRKGSAGGHNGMKSILYHVGDENFPRLRIGIGRPLPGWTVVKHVLAPFSEEDVPKIREAIAYLLPALECVVTDGVDLAMNRYNPKKQKAKKKQQAAVQEAPEITEAAAAQEEK
jgi:PTH1 family peptidyl-tRNA hydrolase